MKSKLSVLAISFVLIFTVLAQVSEADSVSISKFKSLNAAIATIGSVKKITLNVDVPTTMTSTVIVPSNISVITEYPGSINQGSFALTINGPFSAGLYHVFTGTGTVRFGKGVIDFVRPEWSGAKGDDATDNNTAFLLAEASAYASGVPLRLSAGTYRVTSTSGSYAIASRVGIEGESPNTSIIRNVGTGSALKLENGSGTEAGYYQRMKNFSVVGNPSSEDGIVLNPTGDIYKAWAYSTFSSVDSHGHGRNGLVHRASWGTKYYDCKFYENGGLGVWLRSADDDGNFHNDIGFTNCEFRYNGGTGNNTGNYLKGGVRVDGGAQNVYFKGGVVECNNAWGMILGNGFDWTVYDLTVENIYFENNPNEAGASPIGGNVYVSGNYQGIEISKCWGLYGAKAGATGYGFYVANNPIGNSYFKEYGNVLYDVGAGTNIRDFGLQYDWSKPYVSGNMSAGTHTLLLANGTGQWSVSGFVFSKVLTFDHFGIYPFNASYDSSIGSAGFTVRLGSSIVKQDNGGKSDAIASGETIAHGLGAAPDSISVLPAETGATNVYATADATNITVTYDGGGTKTFYWTANKYYRSPVLTAPTLFWDNGALKLVIAPDHYGYVTLSSGTESSPPAVFGFGSMFINDFVRIAN